MGKVNQVLDTMRRMSAGELVQLADKLGLDPKSFQKFWISTLPLSSKKAYRSFTRTERRALTFDLNKMRPADWSRVAESIGYGCQAKVLTGVSLVMDLDTSKFAAEELKLWEEIDQKYSV